MRRKGSWMGRQENDVFGSALKPPTSHCWAWRSPKFIVMRFYIRNFKENKYIGLKRLEVVWKGYVAVVEGGVGALT